MSQAFAVALASIVNGLVASALFAAAYALLTFCGAAAEARFRFLRAAVFGLAALTVVPLLPLGRWLGFSADAMGVKSALVAAATREMIARVGFVAPADALVSMRSVTALVAAYALIAAFLGARIGYGMLRLRRLARHARVVGDAGGTKVLAHSQSGLPPCTIGVLTPVILLPEGLKAELPATDLALVLEHERVHVLRRDFLVKLAWEAATALLFLSPAVWYLRRAFARDMELACDQRVLGNGADPRRYGHLLIELAAAFGSAPRMARGGLSIVDSCLERRILAMKNGKEKSYGRRSAVIALAMTMGAGAFGVGALAVDEAIEALPESDDPAASVEHESAQLVLNVVATKADGSISRRDITITVDLDHTATASDGETLILMTVRRLSGQGDGRQVEVEIELRRADEPSEPGRRERMRFRLRGASGTTKVVDRDFPHAPLGVKHIHLEATPRLGTAD